MKSTAVAELLEGAIQAFGTILQHFQGPVLVLPGRLHLVNRVPFCSKKHVAISGLLHHNVPRVLERLVHIGQAIQCRHRSLIQIVHFTVRFRILLVRGAHAFPAIENPLQCPQIFFCDIDELLPGPVSSFFFFFFLFLLLFLSLLSFLFFPWKMYLYARGREKQRKCGALFFLAVVEARRACSPSLPSRVRAACSR